MRSLFIKYRAVLKFVVIFIGTYTLLSLLYGGYLMLFDNSQFPPDFITNLVAKQSNALLEGMGYDAAVVPNERVPAMKLYLDGKHIADIIEGCNAISIIILFMAFIVSFSEGLKKTVLFILAGSVLIYSVNIIRIVFLTVALYKYPQHEELLHTVVFPAIIYGMVFLLWLIWIRTLQPVTHE